MYITGKTPVPFYVHFYQNTFFTVLCQTEYEFVQITLLGMLCC